MDINNDLWLEKYRPTMPTEFINYNEYMNIIEEWIQPYLENGKMSKPFLLIKGPIGSGKTSLAECIFNNYELKIKEVNSSNFKNIKTFETYLKTPKYSFELKKNGIDFKKYGLLIDDLDALSFDKKYISELLNLIYITKDKIVHNNYYNVRYPVICTYNNISEKLFKKLEKKSILLKIEYPNSNHLEELVKYISKKEKIPLLIRSQIPLFVKNVITYRDIITKLYGLYIDIYIIPSLNKKKEYLKNNISNYYSSDDKKIIMNDMKTSELFKQIIMNFNDYKKCDIIKCIDSNINMFYLSIQTNYYKIKNIHTINTISSILIYGDRLIKYMKLLNATELNSYLLNYVVYGSLYYMCKDNVMTRNKITYHTQLNSIKQDKSYLFNNLRFDIDIINNINLSNSTKELNKLGISKDNNKIINKIFDPDIIYLYKNMNYDNLGFQKSTFKKLFKYDITT